MSSKTFLIIQIVRKGIIDVCIKSFTSKNSKVLEEVTALLCSLLEVGEQKIYGMVTSACITGLAGFLSGNFETEVKLNACKCLRILAQADTKHQVNITNV